MNSHHYWLAAIFDFQEERWQFQSTAGLSGGELAKFLDVRACNESFSAANEYSGFDRIVFVDLLDRGGNALRHTGAQRIHGRIVDGDDGDAVVFSKLNQVAHRLPLFLGYSL